MEKAVDWLVRRDAAAFSAEEQAAFDAWLAADPAHQAAYAHVERIWSDLDSLPAERSSHLRAVGPVGAMAKIADSPVRRPAQRHMRRWVGGALAASLCLVVVFGADVPIRLQADALSAVGQTKTVALPDGSIAILNTNSAIAIDYASGERRVKLLRGEAEFVVAEDAGRPFRVKANNGLSTALGTVFVVRRRDDGATVTVLENRVEVAIDQGGEAGSAEAVLAPNEQVTYAGSGLGPIESLDPQAAAAWRRGKLIFVDRTLGEVIDELNRYHVGLILISGEALRSRRVSGVFETRDPVAVVDALETSLGLSSTRFSERLILLHH